jgi:hypothetical protein
MSAFTQVSSLNGFFYEIYDKIVDPIPDMAKFMAKVGFKGGALEIGNKLHLNVVVSDEGGFTYAARDSGAFAVNDGVSFETQDAQVDAFQLLLQGSVDYESAARASSSRKAFLELVGKKLQVMVASTKRRFESELWYGQSDTILGTVGSITVGRLSFVIAPFEWAPMMWQGKKGHQIDFYVIGAAGALRPAGRYTIVSVALDTRTITIDKALDASVVATDVIAWYGSYGATTAVPKTCAGNLRISGNTGTLFNIDAALYDVWAGNVLDVSSKKLTLAIVMQAMGKLANRGLDADALLWTSPATWSTLVTDQAALRRYGAEIVPVAKNGAKGIEFFYQTGKITILGHGMMKEGYSVVNEMAKWKRVGAQDFSFKTPGLEDGKDIFWHDPNKAGFSYRYYGAQSLFCEMPSHQLIFKNIDNASAT